MLQAANHKLQVTGSRDTFAALGKVLQILQVEESISQIPLLLPADDLDVSAGSEAHAYAAKRPKGLTCFVDHMLLGMRPAPTAPNGIKEAIAIACLVALSFSSGLIWRSSRRAVLSRTCCWSLGETRMCWSRQP